VPENDNLHQPPSIPKSSHHLPHSSMDSSHHASLLGIPRELREIIYAYAGVSRSTTVKWEDDDLQKGIVVSVNNVANVNLLCSCKQVQAEYSDWVNRNLSASIETPPQTPVAGTVVENLIAGVPAAVLKAVQKLDVTVHLEGLIMSLPFAYHLPDLYPDRPDGLASETHSKWTHHQYHRRTMSGDVDLA
jgi:hypothetical protein